MRMFRAVYKRATRQHEDLPANPCVNIDWFPEFRREAAIPYAELHRWYTDVMEIRSPIRRDYLCLCCSPDSASRTPLRSGGSTWTSKLARFSCRSRRAGARSLSPCRTFSSAYSKRASTRMLSSSRSAHGSPQPTAEPDTSPSRKRRYLSPSRFTVCATHSLPLRNRSTSYRAATSPLGTFRSRSIAFANRCRGSPTDSGN